MKRILIAIDSSFIADSLQENFLREGFEVATAKDGKKALDIIAQAPPDIVIADANLPEIDAFGLLEAIKEEEATRRTPLIVYSRTGSNQHREKAMDFEAKDFIVGLSESFKDIVLKVKSHLGEQRAYIFDISPNSEDSGQIIRDLGHKDGTSCPFCGSALSLHLLRNLSWGENAFKASVICSRCHFRYGKSPKEEEEEG